MSQPIVEKTEMDLILITDLHPAKAVTPGMVNTKEFAL